MAALKDGRGVTEDVPLIALADMVNLLELKSDKQRDMAPPRPKAFRLETVKCGEDEDLDPVTTCVVRSADAAEEGKCNSAKQRGAAASL